MNRVVANANNYPPPEPRAAHSTNNPVDPRPARAMVAANGQPIDARTHIMNDQACRERNNLDANYNIRHDNRHGDPNQAR